MSAGSGGPSPKVSNDLSLLAPAFRAAVEGALAECNNATNNLDAMVYEAVRSQELQALYYARGRTVVPPTHTVTNAPTNLHSWHGYGLAVDVVHRTKFWEPPRGEAWFRDVAAIFKRHGCAWGGDWTKPDTPHFQWGKCKPSPSEQARQLFKDRNFQAIWDAVGAGVAGSTASPAPVVSHPTQSALSLNQAIPPMCWGAKVSPAFREKVAKICGDLKIQPDDLMACMAFESGNSFDPAKKNGAGSGAVGLIQFMPSTATSLKTTTAELAAMSAVDQLDFVAKYFAPQKGRLHNLGDIYMAILWPRGIGKPDTAVLFDKNDTERPALYAQNAGLDSNKDLVVTRGEALAKIQQRQRDGMRPENRA